MTASMDIPAGIATRVVRVDRGVLEALPATLAQLGQAGACVLVIDDVRTHDAAGARVRVVLEAAGHPVRHCGLADDRHGQVRGDRHQVDQVVAAAGGDVAVVVGVGSGVINDLGKLAATRNGRTYVSVATAASMNGYGSPVAAIVDGGVKRTLPVAPTAAILADLDVLAAAPIAMTRAGFADLLARSSATADWLLAHIVRDQPYDERPHHLLEPVAQACMGRAAAIGRADPEALGLLMQGLVRGAFAMALAGHSAPASGGEHLLSHLWDMRADGAGTAHALHGFQVAIGTRLSSALYERLLRLEADDVDVEALAGRWRPWEAVRLELAEAHGPLFDVIEPEARRQFLSRDALRRELAAIRQRWDDIRCAVRPLLLTTARLRALHRAACVPADAAAIGQTPSTVRQALLLAADVRARFTVLDLARELDVLVPWADALLDQAGII